MGEKRYLSTSVLDAARSRISFAFDSFEKIYVSFSGGKDSTVMLHLVAEEAIRRGRKFAVLFVDLEGQYKLTIDHVRQCFQMYVDIIEPHWICLPLNLRNAVSSYEPQWLCWDSQRKIDWIREKPKEASREFYPFFHPGMEFEEFVPAFAEWYADGKTCGCFVGIRSDESLNRWRTIAGNKQCFHGRKFTTWIKDGAFNIYPIYDWKTQDIWRYHGKFAKPYNRLYDLMNKAGLSIHQQRICQPYGDDQRRGLWLFHIIEPETWARVVARVNGANSGALYVQETGNMTGYNKISKPAGHTWESFAKLLLDSQPLKTKEQFENKISVFLHWWEDRGYPNGIPDEADPKEEASRKTPSWRRVCKALLRNDYWCKGLSFTQTKSANYEKYKKIMKKRRMQWNRLF